MVVLLFLSLFLKSNNETLLYVTLMEISPQTHASLA